MEHDLFDALTRTLTSADSRRGTVRALCVRRKRWDQAARSSVHQ